MSDLSIEEKIRLFELAAQQVGTYEDNRLFSYATKVRVLLDAIMTFEVAPTDPLNAIERLEIVLMQLEEKIQKRQNYEIVMRLLD
ncbi:hypothetical protein [Desertivirga brevis]|uniref:hypothetical protein n=1 Tax=Desertivirga brevis TaxID=2810310 RepID=UPI001A9669C8|nr:hypothetical protein [Pedobacter sp. SYSU D00873]